MSRKPHAQAYAPRSHSRREADFAAPLRAAHLRCDALALQVGGGGAMPHVVAPSDAAHRGSGVVAEATGTGCGRPWWPRRKLLLSGSGVVACVARGWRPCGGLVGGRSSERVRGRRTCRKKWRWLILAGPICGLL